MFSDNPNTSIERRDHHRISLHANCVAPRLFHGVRKIVDISRGGMRLSGDNCVDIGTDLEVYVILDNMRTIVAVARIVWRSAGKSRREFDYGIEFTKIDELDSRILDIFLEIAAEKRDVPPTPHGCQIRATDASLPV